MSFFLILKLILKLLNTDKHIVFVSHNYVGTGCVCVSAYLMHKVSHTGLSHPVRSSKHFFDQICSQIFFLNNWYDYTEILIYAKPVYTTTERYFVVNGQIIIQLG